MKNAKFALVIAKPLKTEQGRPLVDMWRDFLVNTGARGPGEQTPLPPEKVWELSLPDSLPLLGMLLYQGDPQASVRVLFLEEAPQWLEWPPPPTRR
jgi:hypothetical protein